MPEETIWEVWMGIDTNSEWILNRQFYSYKEAKRYYDAKIETSHLMFRIVRAETHRSVVLEDLRGNIE